MTSNVRKNFQRNLNNYLKANKMNQADLSEKLGVSSATTSDWSTGKKVPKMDRIEEVARILGVTSSNMLADENEAKIYYLDRQAREVTDPQFLKIYTEQTSPSIVKRQVALKSLLTGLGITSYQLWPADSI